MVSIRPTKGTSFVSSIFSMAKLAYQAQPLICVVAILLTLLQAILPITTAWLTKLLFDKLILGLKEATIANIFSDLLPILILQTILIIVAQVTGLINDFLNAELGRKLTENIELAVHQKINSFVGIVYFESQEFHSILQLGKQGAQQSVSGILRTVIGLFRATTTLISFFGVLMAFNPYLTIPIVLATLPHLLAQIKFGKQRFNLSYSSSLSERYIFYYAYLLTDPQIAKEIRLFDLSKYLLDKLINTYHTIHKAKHDQQWLELRWQTLLDALFTIVSSLIFIAIIFQVILNRLSVGDITLYNNAVSTIQGSLLEIYTEIGQLSQSKLFFSNYEALMALPQPVYIATKPHPIPKLNSGIEFRKVSFRYTERQPWVLKDINLFIPANKCLALIGLNGAGKTTLVKLLTRLYDATEGEILWDGINIQEFDPHEYRLQIGTILQDFTNYYLTVQENIGLGNIARINDSKQVHCAARKAGIHNKIKNLPKRYETILGPQMVKDDDTGVNLSGGEWQKIAIARLFMREASLLILDEPTASLDVKAEYELYQYFTELVNKRTNLLISHRFSTTRMADIVAILEDGKITEYGTHDELILLGGTYANLYQMQTQQYGITPGKHTV